MFFIVLVFLLNSVHQSLLVIVQPSNLLEAAGPVQVSPKYTSCCTGTTGCVNVSTSPWCAYDSNYSTSWIFPSGQLNASLTLNLSTSSLIDRFELTLDPSSITPTSIVVSVLNLNGTQITSWATYLNQTCQPNDGNLRRMDSTYYSCRQSGNKAWNISVPTGLFSVRNGSNGWYWWRPFQVFQLTVEMTQSDYSNQNGVLAIQDILLYGWNQPNQTCNCHPVGVADTNFPCNSHGTCNCRDGRNDFSQCVPFVTQVVPSYGPISGGTAVSIFGNYLQNPTKVTIGCSASITTGNDTEIQLKTNGCALAGVYNPLPVWICWEQPNNGFNSCIVLSYMFTYKPDPVIQSIYPRKSIDRGGIQQTVIGEYLDSVAYPYLIVFSVTGNKTQEFNYTTAPYQNINNYTFCQHVSSTELICTSMPLTGISASNNTKLYIGISVDINKYRSSSRQCDIADGQCNFTLGYVDRLNINPWTDDPVNYHSSSAPLNITGQHFLYGATPGDYWVTVDENMCSITSVSDNTVTFSPGPCLVDTTTKQEIILHIGVFYSFSVGYLKYTPDVVTSRTNVLIGAVVGGLCGFGLGILIAVLIVRYYKKKNDNELHRSQLEIRYSHTASRRDVAITEYLPEQFRESVMRYTVPYDRIELVRELGKGQFGKVFEGNFRDKNGVEQPVAIKTLHTAAGRREIEDKVEFLEEAMLMADFCHVHVLSLLAIVIDKNIPFVVLPFMEHGDLKGFVSDPDNDFTAGDLVNFSLQVAEGMEYLASKKFVHRDLAARNCMVNKDLVVKVADFGLARDIFKNDYYRPQDKHRPLPFKWMAIECMSSKTCFTEKSDVWAYGVLVWELMTRGEQPYSCVDNFELRRFLLEGRRLEKPSDCPDFMYTIMKSCWHEVATERPQFKEIVNDLKEILKTADLKSTSTLQSVSKHQHQKVSARATNSYARSISSNTADSASPRYSANENPATRRQDQRSITSKEGNAYVELIEGNFYHEKIYATESVS